MYHCVVYIAGAQNLSKLSTSMCGGHAGCLSVWWMWCYRSTKDICCPIQQGIQARISSLWMGLWCICASGCLISANRKGANGWPQLSADSSIVWGQFVGAGFVCLGLPHALQAHLSITDRLIWGNTAVPPQLGLINICLLEALSCFRII